MAARANRRAADPDRDRRRGGAGSSGDDRATKRAAGPRRHGPQSVRRTRPADGRPARPVAAERERERSRTVRAAATFGLSTTRRAAVFAIVVCALALSVAVPLRTYLSQRDDVEIQEQRQQELREQVETLEERRNQLEDPAQVKAEARRRLRYVMPGETPYIVELPGDGDGQAGGEPSDRQVLDQSWYQLLWNAVSGE